MADRILKQFETLRRVTPSSSWQENSRAVLMESVKKSNLTNNVFRQQENNNRMEQWLTFVYRLRGFLPRPSRAISFAVVVMMFSTMAFATQASTPKDKKLYTVKKFYERVELAVTFSDEKAIETHLKHANNRKEEMVKLVEESKTANQKTTDDIKIAVQETAASLAKDIQSAKNTLDVIQEVGNKDESKSDKIASLAKDMAVSSQDALKTLETVKQVDDTALTKTVDNAKETVEKIETESLKILVEKVVEVAPVVTLPVNTSSTTSQVSEIKSDNKIILEKELKQLITNKIERVDQKIEETKIKLETSVASGDLSSNTAKNNAEKKVITELTKAPVVAQEKLNEAKKDLDSGSVITALDKVNETTVLVKESVKAINEAGVKNLVNEATKVVAPTTTPIVIPKVEEKAILKSSVQELNNDGKTATPTEVINGLTDEFGQEIGDKSQEIGL